MVERFYRVLTALVVLTSAVPSRALAFSGGESGYSGQNGSTCTGCHGGGPTPTVTLSGPTTLNAGSSGTYTLTITGGNAVQGGLDVSVAGGATLAATGTGERLLNGEVTQSTPGGFNAGTLLYTFTLAAPSTAGTLTLYAAGLSSNGSTGGSGTATARQTITVNAPTPGNVPPTVSLTGPANGTSFPSGSSVTLTATAADSDGTVAQVDFYADGAKLGTATAAPYSFTWTSPASGAHTLTAIATDNGGASTTSAPVSITVGSAADAGTPPPNDAGTPAPGGPGSPISVSITAPAAGATFADQQRFTVTAAAEGSRATVQSVSFFVNRFWIGSAWNAPFSVMAPGLPPGTYSLTARAVDRMHRATVSAPVTITVTGTPCKPSATITCDSTSALSGNGNGAQGSPGVVTGCSAAGSAGTSGLALLLLAAFLLLRRARVES